MKKSILLLLVTFFLLSLACGELVVPVEETGSGSGQPGSVAAPENEAAEPLETLAPLPADGVESAAPEDEGIDPSTVESVVVNDIAWQLLDAVYLGESLDSGVDEVADLVADGRLIGVRFTITNEGEELHTYIGLELVDGSGQRYDYLSEGLWFIVEEEACELVELEPAATTTCTAIYDVPFEASGLQAVITDLSLTGGEEKLVDLGLE